MNSEVRIKSLETALDHALAYIGAIPSQSGFRRPEGFMSPNDMQEILKGEAEVVQPPEPIAVTNFENQLSQLVLEFGGDPIVVGVMEYWAEIRKSVMLGIRKDNGQTIRDQVQAICYNFMHHARKKMDSEAPLLQAFEKGRISAIRDIEEQVRKLVPMDTIQTQSEG